MGIERVYTSDGVPQLVFDAHAHNYRKVTQLGVDSAKTYASPARVGIVDDSEVNIADNTDLEAVGVTVATEPTSTPV